MGDPAGIGPEICLDLLNDSEISDLCTPIVFGDSAVLQSCAKKTHKSFDIIEISENQLGESSQNGIFDLGLMNVNELNPGTADAKTGRATYGLCDFSNRCLCDEQSRCCSYLPRK
jgi:4-hydroxythreonine-4-phosphate dehydrogenase